MSIHQALTTTVVTTLCWIAGCDTFSGVSRTIPLEAIPPADALEQAIRATPGIVDVSRNEVLPTESWSLYKGTIRQPGYISFVSRREGVLTAAVDAKDTSDARKQLEVSRTWMNHVPTESELADARQLIDRICLSLHEHIPAIPASSPADDRFVGIPGCAHKGFVLSEDSPADRLMSTRFVANLGRAIPKRHLMCMVDYTAPDAVYLYLGDEEGDHTTRVAFCRVTTDGRVWVNQTDTGVEDRWLPVE